MSPLLVGGNQMFASNLRLRPRSLSLSLSLSLSSRKRFRLLLIEGLEDRRMLAIDSLGPDLQRTIDSSQEPSTLMELRILEFSAV